MTDDTADSFDIPSLPNEAWANAIKNPYYRPLKQQVTVRIDADVVAWLRSKGDGYQTRLNDHLRSAMRGELEKQTTPLNRNRRTRQPGVAARRQAPAQRSAQRKAS